MSENISQATRLIAEVDRVIHEPSRLMIMTILATVKEADFLFLQNETQLTKGNLSSHLSKLEASKYIKIEKTYRGKIPLTICSLSSTGKEAFDKYCKQLKSFTEMM